MVDPRHDPDRPHQPILATRHSQQSPLTIESIDHLRKFIGHVLEEETGFRDVDKDAWVSAIEGALNDLARAVDSGVWLSGIRRARAVLAPKRKEQPEAARAEVGVREQERMPKDKETEARNKAKSRVPAGADKPAKETDPAGAEVKTEPSHDVANRNLSALQQLRNLANARRPPSSDVSKRAQHLLLTVAPPDTPPPRPPSSVPPEGDATPQRCTFTPGIYSLPAPDLFGEDPDDNCQAVVNSTLYGFEDWDGACLTFHSPAPSN
jgi:1-phosphatidylinositol-3-phosphate 5-kinase